MCMVFFIWDMDYCGCILMNNRSRLCNFFFFFFFLAKASYVRLISKRSRL